MGINVIGVELEINAHVITTWRINKTNGIADVSHYHVIIHCMDLLLHAYFVYIHKHQQQLAMTAEIAEKKIKKDVLEQVENINMHGERDVMRGIVTNGL